MRLPVATLPRRSICATGDDRTTSGVRRKLSSMPPGASGRTQAWNEGLGQRTSPSSERKHGSSSAVVNFTSSGTFCKHVQQYDIRARFSQGTNLHCLGARASLRGKKGPAHVARDVELHRPNVRKEPHLRQA